MYVRLCMHARMNGNSIPNNIAPVSISVKELRRPYGSGSELKLTPAKVKSEDMIEYRLECESENPPPIPRRHPGSVIRPSELKIPFPVQPTQRNSDRASNLPLIRTTLIMRSSNKQSGLYRQDETLFCFSVFVWSSASTTPF